MRPECAGLLELYVFIGFLLFEAAMEAQEVPAIHGTFKDSTDTVVPNSKVTIIRET
jgi:hypothetical protein